MLMDVGTVGLALGAGIIAFFNPCGFPLLSSYIAYYLGSKQGVSPSRERWWERGLQGFRLGATVSTGFFTVFLVLGGVISVMGTTLGSYFPWAAVAIGCALVVLGVLTLFGHELKLSLPSWGRARSEGFFFYYLYGIGYAIASCGCTLPIFINYVVRPALTAGVGIGLLSFLAYASGMTTMMILLALSIAYSKGGLERRLPWKQALVGLGIPVGILLTILWVRPEIAASLAASFSGANRVFVSILASALPAMLFFQLWHWERAIRWLNAFLLIAAGSYLIYYQLFEYGLLDLGAQ